MENRVTRWVFGASALLLGGAWVAVAQAQAQEPKPAEPTSTMLRDGFETNKIAWRQERTDATVRIFAHERTNRAAHEGLLSEGFQFEAGIGGGLYFSYRLPNIPVTDDLKVSLYVRSNRTGAQLLGRVVLPSDIDPDTRQPSFVLVPGSSFDSADRWHRLELNEMLPAIERQAKVLRASTRRPVSLKGAYLERLVMNIYGGEGETDVFLDELVVGPVPTSITANPRAEPSKGPKVRTIADRPRADNEPLEAVLPGANARIKLDRNRLSKDGFPWFFTAIRAPDADPAKLRRIGFDVQVIPKGTDEAMVQAAMASGLLLIPELTGPDDRVMPEPDRLVASAKSFPGRDATAFWSLGQNLGRSIDLDTRKASLLKVRDTERAFRAAKPGGSGMTTATISGMLADYVRVPEHLDIAGIPTAAWATMQDPFEFYQFIDQRKLLSARGNPDALLWANIEVMAPPIYQESIWGTDPPPSWGLPRIQPEQIRISTYAAIAGGVRGLNYLSDASLTQDFGRANLIELALLNEEIDLLEPILADPDKLIRMMDTFLPDPPPAPPMTLFQMNTGGVGGGLRAPTPKEYPPNPTIKAAAITTKDRRGVLLMVADYYKYAQYQPPQSAMNNVVLRVPAPSDALAYLISPGGVEPLATRREPGGVRVTLEDFGVTALVLITTNRDLVNQIEESVNHVRPMAVSLAIEQAELMYNWVVEIDELLKAKDHPQKHSVDLLNKANELIKSARDALEREDYQTAWNEARRVGRPLRILMRYHFMACYDDIIAALRDKDLPCGPIPYPGFKKPKPRIIPPIVAAPLASWSTLPKAWDWYEWIRRGILGKNLVPNGNFSDPDVLETGGWTPVCYKTDEIQTVIKLNDGGPDTANPNKKIKTKGKGQNLVLIANPQPGTKMDSLVPFVDHPVVGLRSPSVKVRAQEIYRISVMAYSANQTVPGAGGLIIRDSVGGERLQFRTTNALAMDWFEIVYYRRIPADGEFNVTLSMAGYGFAAFDDFKIQAIVGQLTDEEIKLIESKKPKFDPRKQPEKDDEDKDKDDKDKDQDKNGREKSDLVNPIINPNRTANLLQGSPVRQ
jgi:hypothetical protein